MIFIFRPSFIALDLWKAALGDDVLILLLFNG